MRRGRLSTGSRRRRSATAAAGLALAALMLLPATAVAAAADEAELPLLTDPFLQLPAADSVRVVWMTEFPGSDHVVLVGEGVGALSAADAEAAARGETFPGVRTAAAETAKFSRLAEDSSSRLPEDRLPAEEDGIVARDVWRHEAAVDALTPGERTPYRVVSLEGANAAVSDTYTLAPAPAAGQDMKILLTSDHQAMANTPANLQKAAETIGDFDAVFLAGDLVNHPDRASEWFDDTRGSSFFAALQGNGGRVDNNGVAEYVGGEILQHAPLFPAVGNHEVQGRIDGMSSIGASYNAAVPRDVAEAEYEKVAAEVNPTGDPDVRAQWIEDNSFSTTTYREMFTLPDDSPGGEEYYAVSLGDVRLVSLYSTRIWRGTANNADPAARTTTSRYQEAAANLDDALAQGYGEHVFESLAVGSEQYEWLRQELESDDFQDARFRVIMLHEGPQGLGDNVMPHFANPERIEEIDDDGNVIGVRYEYPASGNMLLNDLTPLIEGAGTDLVLNGHSHLWNRFESENGVNYLETSNTGNTYGAYHELSGRTRPLPAEPWDASNYLSTGNPGGLEPVVPTVAPFLTADGTPEPYVQSNDLAVFAVLDTGANEVVSYVYDVRTPEVDPWVFDRFSLGREADLPDDGSGDGGSVGPGDDGDGGDGDGDGSGSEGMTVTLGASTVAAGGMLSVTVEGLAPEESARIALHSTPVLLAEATADEAGALTETVRIPADTAPGTHTIVVTAGSGATVAASITVTAAEELAATGTDAGGILALIAGAALLVGGGTAAWAGLRRRARRA